MRRAAAIGVCTALACALVAGAAAAADEAELEELREAIAESRERVADYERRERGLLETVEALDRSLSVLVAETRRARGEADAARDELDRIEAEAADLEVRLAATQRALAARANALYRAGEVGPLRLLFTAGGLRELLSRVSALRRLVRHDAELLARRREESRLLAAARVSATEASLRLEAAADRLRERTDLLDAERRAKRRVVARLHEDRARERAALIELETAARALEETLASLGSASPRDPGLPPGPPFASRRGRLDAPVDARIVGDYGRVVDSEFRTETFRKGVEFGADHGEPVRAVAAGRVRYAGWFRGYGKLVIVDHGGDYFTVSGHLQEMHVDVGDAVAEGTGIGLAGDTGSLDGPRLYFEIRRGGASLDPRDWLRQRGAG